MRFVHTADTHLGFEVARTAPHHTIGRMRRAEAIHANFKAVVEYAREVEADIFIHSGDLYDKHYLPKEVLEDMVRPMVELVREGIPVLLIPGNHERSAFPFGLFHGTKNLFVLDRPKSLMLTLDGYSVAFAGFPFIRNHSRDNFLKALDETEYRGLRSDLKFLVTHQTFDQARCGPVNYVFTARRPDTFPRDRIPLDFDYIAAGHIHFHQILSHPLKPELKIVYPGSIQRVSFAEREEPKGFVEGEVFGGRIETRFLPLPAYSMETVEIQAAGMSARACEVAIREQFWRLHPDLVIRFNLTGGKSRRDYPDMDFERIRATMPPVLECTFAIRVKNRWVLK